VPYLTAFFLLLAILGEARGQNIAPCCGGPINVPTITLPTTITLSGSHGEDAGYTGLLANQAFFGSSSKSGAFGFNFLSASNILNAPSAEVDTLRVNQSLSSSSIGGQFSAISATVNQIARTGNKVAGVGQTEMVPIQSFVFPGFSEGGTGTGLGASYGVTEGINSNTGLGPGATNFYGLIGEEIDLNAASGSSVSYKSGLWIIEGGTDSTTGALVDSAIMVANVAGAPGWSCILCLGKNDAVAPTNTNSTFVGVNNILSGTTPLKYGVDFNAVTGTSGGFALRGPSASYRVDWSGNAAFASYAVGATAGVSCAAGTVNLTTLVVTAGIVTHC
jgi:hypothetical protein